YALEGHPMEIENFSLEMVNYDKNGNITYLKRHGLDVSSNEMDYIDDLTYNYAPQSNTWISVIDIASEDAFKDGNTINEDYFYDDNGNMTQDKNKHIAHIEYNHLNLPTFIYIESSGDGGGDINYTYDATGVKLEKVVNSGMDINATYYAGSYIYEESSQMGLMGPISSGIKLKFFNQPEGYVEPNNSGNFDYIYQYKDHLGNIRLSYKNISNNITPVLEIQEENNYYPFGLKHKGYNNNIVSEHNWDYQGKENQKELSLNWHDFGARNYDAALGRWMNTDPLSEEFYSYSPYNAMMNNPLNFIDPTGMAAEWIPSVNENGSTTYTAEAGDSANTLSSQYGISQSDAEAITGTIGDTAIA